MITEPDFEQGRGVGRLTKVSKHIIMVFNIHAYV